MAIDLEPADLGPIVPVVVLDDPARARDLMSALAAGGIRSAEIALRTPHSFQVLEAAATVPGIVVGAGTVIDPEVAKRVVDAGARFVVSPGFDETVATAAAAAGADVVPGVATASEVQRALRAGLSRLKFFPAEPLGGVAAIRALAGPFPQVSFLPSGGISAARAPAYLAEPTVFAVSGSWMVPADALASGDWERVERLSAEAVSLR
ncbi:MAG TPA: bifunctional 4-hydroxy-2-oxoglutarate aldolase/2-dehydro-3-deoxy-phosphogluconate aldolase [Pseudolysinimonas sp.]|nr:bifunctional 4-hydroxy-2-oxoglutarate aldolase/2-dehydro-3-deoxy-phosphogluconate aldolase [Pseudolysinimonas sp.]